MKRFKTYIITRKLLRRIFLILICIIMLFIFLYNTYKKQSVSVFSDNSVEILNKSLIRDDVKSVIKEISNEVLGFDMDDPTTIIEDSTFVVNQPSKATIEPSPAPSNVEGLKNRLPLLSHNEIITANNLKIKNDTEYLINLDELCSLENDIKLSFSHPEVLIVHTHTTECYNGDAMSGESERTTNESYNVSKIGSIISKRLEEYGIKTIHDKTIHDYPTYQSAYSRALKTIQKNIEQNPSIQVVLDIHRDAYIYDDGSKLSVSTKLNNESVAQVMLVLGTNSMGLEHSNWQSNLKLATKIQNTAEKTYPGLVRPLNLRKERFNMHLTKGSLLLEIGSNGNSLREAELAAEYIADCIATVLING